VAADTSRGLIDVRSGPLLTPQDAEIPQTGEAYDLVRRHTADVYQSRQPPAIAARATKSSNDLRMVELLDTGTNGVSHGIPLQGDCQDLSR